MKMTASDITDNSKTDVDIAVMLVEFDNFSEFRQAAKYKNKVSELMQYARNHRGHAYSMAEKALSVLGKINYQDNQSYNAQLEPLIDIFAQGYSDIVPFLLRRQGGKWVFTET